MSIFILLKLILFILRSANFIPISKTIPGVTVSVNTLPCLAKEGVFLNLTQN